MHVPKRLIEVGGADRPVLPMGLTDYVGIDPLYGSLPRYATEVERQASEWNVKAQLFARTVETVAIDEVGKSPIVIMRNVLGNKLTGHIDVVRAALGFVAEGGQLIIIEDITAAQAKLSEVEAAMEAEGRWAAIYGAAQPTFINTAHDLGLDAPQLAHKMLKVSPHANPLEHTVVR